MTGELVSYSESAGVATVTMDDGKANALSTTMVEQLGVAFDRAEAEAKAVVLVGREGKFCAGFDLREMMAGPDSVIALVTRGGNLLLRLYELGMPLVVACTGHALAGGILLAATGDLRIGARGAFKLGLNEVQSGIPVPLLAYEFARDRLLPTELLASVVHSKIYDPDAAARAGWLDRVVAPDEVVAEAHKEATRLAALPKNAYVASKRGLRNDTINLIRDRFDSNLAELLRPPT